MRFDAFATLQRGFDLPLASRRVGTIPVLGSNGIVGWHDTVGVRGPGVVTGRSGSIGDSTFVDTDYWPLNTALYVSNFHGNFPRFVHYFLQWFDLARFKGGVSVPTLNRNMVHGSEVTVPKGWEQQKIAAVLWKMQRAIATQDRLIATNRDLKQSAMQHLFTHGLHGEPLKDTEIGPMPESWSPAPVASCVAPYRFDRSSQLLASAYRKQGKWPVVDQGQDEIAGYTDDENKVQRPGFALIIFGDHSRTLKYVDYPFVFGADGTKPFVASDGIDTVFLFQALRHLNIPSKGYSRHYRSLSESLIARPSNLDEQRDIAAALATIDRKLAHHQKKCAALNDLFQTTLHQLMTAQIRVADLDIDTSEVATPQPQGVAA